ncbi:MAG: glucokinase [Cyanobacteria bacterium Co-bin8]|nr:glucokinase [Cyanobacteria bacterium Co-bin8]
MTYLLAGDIGGTKTILRLVRVHPDPTAATARTLLESCYEERYFSAAYPDLVPMVKAFLHEAEARTGEHRQPTRACFAIAGPVVDNTSSLTNLSWSLSAQRLEADLQLEKVHLINDFEAVGYGTLGLQADDLQTLQAGQYDANAPIAVIGAGTGLGQGFLIPKGDTFTIFPTEGGHADFAPRSELEFQLLKYLRDKHQISRVSVERVVSGQGIVSIYQFLRDRQYAEESPSVAEAITTWERQTGMQTKTVDPGAAISLAALEKRDRLCEKTMEIFVEAYGAEAGNLGLKLLPYGGLYVAGGIAAKNLPLMQTGAFLRAFSDKGRVSHLLEKVPVHIILNAQVGLVGAALCAARL